MCAIVAVLVGLHLLPSVHLGARISDTSTEAIFRFNDYVPPLRDSLPRRKEDPRDPKDTETEADILAAEALNKTTAHSKLHAGVVTIDRNGFKVKPQFRFGGNVRGVEAGVGIWDVRDGLKVHLEAAAVKTYMTRCIQLAECFTMVKPRTKLKGIDTLITAAPNIVGYTLEKLHMDKSLPLLKEFEGTVSVGVSYGWKAAIWLGWTDTNGWRRIGTEFELTSFAIALVVGYHTEARKIRMSGSLGPFDFDFIGTLKDDEEVSNLEKLQQ